MLTVLDRCKLLNREFGDVAEYEAWSRWLEASNEEDRRHYMACAHYYEAVRSNPVIPEVVQNNTADNRYGDPKFLLGLVKFATK